MSQKESLLSEAHTPNTPVLHTERMILDPFAPQHRDRLLLIWNEPGVRRFLWDDKPVTVEMADEVLAISRSNFTEHRFGVWSLVDKHTNEIIGFVGLRFFDGSSDVELLYSLTEHYWGRGLATEAARGCLSYAFSQLQLSKIIAVANPDNPPSWKVLEKVGMKWVRTGEFRGEPLRWYEITRADVFDK